MDIKTDQQFEALAKRVADAMAERLANADYEHNQSMYNPDGTIG